MMRLVRRFALFCVMLGIAFGTVRAQAPMPVAAPTDARMTTVDSLVLAGDTVAALEMLSAIIEDDDRNAIAWHRQGELALFLARPPGTKISWNARTIRYMDLADSSLARAGYLAPDSARYHLTRGMYFLASGAPMVMVAAGGAFRRGLAVAQRVDDSTMVAELAIQLGLRYWKTYEGLSGRRSVLNVSLPQMVSDAENREEVDHLIDLYFPDESTRFAEKYFLAARDFFLIALEVRPDSRRAWTYAYLTLLALETWEELEAATLVRLGSASDDALAWMARGLAFHWQGQDSESALAFKRGLELFEPGERRRLTRVGRLLRPTDSDRIDTLSEPQQLATELVFWMFNDPLAVTAENEHWLEFLSRVTYAELMFSVDEVALRGADTPRGEVFVRYGKPRDILVTLDAGGYGILWRYSNGLDFFFQLGVLRTVNEDGFAPLRKHFERIPHSFANVPVTSEMDTIPFTVTRFRGTADSTVVVAAQIPIGRLARGVDLSNGTFRIGFLTFTGSDLRRDTTSLGIRLTDEALKRSELRTWSARFGSPELGFRVEAYQVESGKGARALGSVPNAPSAGFGMSDILIADRLSPTVSSPERWLDLEVQPNLGTLQQGEDLAIAWETYDLGADSTRSSECSVEISLVRTDGSRLGRAVARVIGGTLGLGEGRGRDDRVAVSFDRRVPARPVTLDYLTLDLGDIDPGRYRLTITIADAVRGASAESVRELVIEK